MKATEAKLLEFLKKSPQFVIPIYQRSYSWGEKECRQLWDDILRTGRNDAVSAHFVGSIVYVEKGLYSVSSQSSLLVIDGQQRLTTVTLELPRFRGYFLTWEKGVHDAEESRAIPGGVSTADGRVGALGADAGGAGGEV